MPVSATPSYDREVLAVSSPARVDGRSPSALEEEAKTVTGMEGDGIVKRNNGKWWMNPHEVFWGWQWGWEWKEKSRRQKIILAIKFIFQNWWRIVKHLNNRAWKLQSRFINAEVERSVHTLKQPNPKRNNWSKQSLFVIYFKVPNKHQPTTTVLTISVLSNHLKLKSTFFRGSASQKILHHTSLGAGSAHWLTESNCGKYFFSKA